MKESAVLFRAKTSSGTKKSASIDYAFLNAFTLDISNAKSSSKLKYHKRLANKLNDTKIAPKHVNTIKRD